MILNRLANLFPLYVILGGVLAAFFPSYFSWFRGQWIVLGLGAVMLGMGATLRIADFRRITQIPGAVILGLLAQFSIMPTLGWGIGKALALPPAIAAGLILVACCPGGTASNIVAYLAKANVALSVTLTMLSTFASVGMTPLLTSWLAGTIVQVDAWGLVASTAQVVVLPVLLGLGTHKLAPKFTERFLLPGAPLFSALVVALICASIIGQNAASLRQSGLSLFVGVFFLHTGGFALGYFMTKLASFDKITRRTISIEVGMQNSGLGVVLAQRHFPDPITALPCALSSVFHSVIGSLLAAWWRQRDAREK